MILDLVVGVPGPVAIHGLLISAGLSSTIMLALDVAAVPRSGRKPLAGRPRPREGFLVVGVVSEIKNGKL